MIDPNNVLVRCPNGHQLQAARQHLSRPLSCPVCNVTFTPGLAVVGDDEGAPDQPKVSSGDRGDSPEEVSVSPPGGLTTPVSPPEITNWMLGLWIAFSGVRFVESLIAFFREPQVETGAADASQSMARGLFFCSLLLVLLAAIVLQLAWIYRVHKDAVLSRGYRGVSPGLALGLSLIPIFNYTWTGWAVFRLARFAAREDRPERTAPDQAVGATALCLLMGLVLTLIGTGGLAFTAYELWQTVVELNAAGISPGTPEFQARLRGSGGTGPEWVLIYWSIHLISVLVYVRGVRCLQRALYAFDVTAGG